MLYTPEELDDKLDKLKVSYKTAYEYLFFIKAKPCICGVKPFCERCKSYFNAYDYLQELLRIK